MRKMRPRSVLGESAEVKDFHDEESEGLLPVLHLGSDWLSSHSAGPYKCWARLHLGCLRHPGERLSGKAGIMVGRTSLEAAGWKG